MYYWIKFLPTCAIVLVLMIFNSCNNSSEPETLFASSDRYSDQFSFSPLVNIIVITNPIGFTYLYGSTDTTRVKYVIDRSVHAKSKTLAQSELNKIDLEHIISNDTLFCNIAFPSDLNNIYECNLSLDVHYKKNVAVKIPNKGVYAAYLYANLSIETEAYETIVEQHTGSLEIHSTDGSINSTLTISKGGYCRCDSETGDINVKIPSNTSANVTLKTNTGSISYSNLNLSITTSTNQELIGTLGAGEGEIYLESNHGIIVLEGI